MSAIIVAGLVVGVLAWSVMGVYEWRRVNRRDR